MNQEEWLIRTRDKKIRVINSIANLQQEEEKLKIARERLELDRFKALGHGGEGEDDDDEDDNDGDDLIGDYTGEGTPPPDQAQAASAA